MSSHRTSAAAQAAPAAAARFNLASNSVLLVTFAGFDVASLFVFNVACARLLDLEGYGRLAYVLSYVLLLAHVADFGTALASTTLIAREPDQSRRWTSCGVSTRLCLAGLFLALSLGAAPVLMPDVPAALVALAAGAEALRTLMTYVAFSLRGLQRMRYEPVFLGADRLLMIALSLAALKAGLGLAGVLAAMLAARLAASALAAFFFIRVFGLPELRLDWPGARQLFSHAAPIASTMLYHHALMYVPPLVLARSWGAAALGPFQAAFKVALVPVYASTALTQSLYSELAARAAGSAQGEPQRLYSITVKTVLNMILPVVAVISVFAEELVVAIYGRQYRDAAGLLRALCAYTIGQSIVSNSVHVLYAERRTGSVLAVVSAAIALMALGSAVVVPRYGGAGAAATTSAVAAAAACLATAGVRRCGYRLQYRAEMLRQVAAAAGIYLLLAWLHQVRFLGDAARACLAGATALAVYLPLLCLARALSPDERSLLAQLWRRLAVLKGC